MQSKLSVARIKYARHCSARVALSALAWIAVTWPGPIPAGERLIELKVLAHSGEVAPGTAENATFSNGAFSAPVINAHGEVAFQAGLLNTTLPNTDRGIWAQSSGVLGLAVRKSDAAPGTAEVFGGFSELRINNASQLAFRGNLLGVSPLSDEGIWSTGQGSLQLIAREGNGAPVIGEDFVSFGPIVFNNLGQTAFRAMVTGKTGADTVWSEASGSLGIVARSSTTVPVPENDLLLFADPVLNDDGRTAFWAQMSGMGDWSIWSEASGTLGLVARQLQLAPGSFDPVSGEPQEFSTFHNDPVINNANRTAFAGSSGAFASNLGGIWKEVEGGMQLVARETSLAPGTINGFRNFLSPVRNHRGHVAFRASLYDASPADDVGFWTDSQGLLALIVREGDHAPGMPPDVNFSFINPTSMIPAMNSNGTVAIVATLAGPGIDGSNNVGIWVYAELEGHFVFRTGELLEIDPGVFKQITGISFISGTGNQDGRPSGLGDNETLAFLANYIGGQAIVVADLHADFVQASGFESNMPQ